MQALAIAHNTNEMQLEEWLGHRKKGIGGSDAATVFSFNKYKSRVELYLEKTGEKDLHQEETEAAEWGREMEPILTKKFSQKTGLKVEPTYELLSHPEYPFMLANLDSLVHQDGELGVLECKTASEYLKDYWIDDLIPDAYMFQVQHYLAVTGLKFAYIAVLIGGNKFRYKFIERDEELISMILQEETKFWYEHVLAKVPPAWDGSSASTDLLKKLHPADNGETIELPENAGHWILKYKEIGTQIKEMEKEKDEFGNLIKAALGDNSVGMVGGLKVTYNTINKKESIVKATSYRQMRIYGA